VFSGGGSQVSIWAQSFGAIGRLMQNSDFHSPPVRIIVKCTPMPRAAELQELAKACGCLLAADPEHFDLLLVDFSSISNPSSGDWGELAGYLHDNDRGALIWTDLERLDAGYAILPIERCHFVLGGEDWQAAPILAGIFRRKSMNQLHDLTRDGEIGALHRISSELADFARTLARIAEQDNGPPSAVRDKPIGFRAAPAGLLQPVVQPARPNAAQIREMIKLRRMRDRFFDAELFADPGWDIMLDLYAAQAEGKQVSVSSLCIAAAVPPTTALRWITNMTEMGLLERKQDPYDARRVFIVLADATLAKLDGYFAACNEKAVLAI
jgi:DNA-binding MarR family transcriptional regulator